MWDEREELDYELGAQLGDPRRCSIHPDVKTSSNDGMFDAPCWKCENLIDEHANQQSEEDDLKHYAMHVREAGELVVLRPFRKAFMLALMQAGWQKVYALGNKVHWDRRFDDSVASVTKSSSRKGSSLRNA
jgi:hypothetical protein